MNFLIKIGLIFLLSCCISDSIFGITIPVNTLQSASATTNFSKINCYNSPHKATITQPKILLSSTFQNPITNSNHLPRVFFVAFILGLLAVFTPYVYAILPITVSYISIISKTKSHGLRNSIYYALSLTLIFTALGVLIAVLIGTTGLDKLTKNWIFNLFFCRIFLGLGLSFLGAFELHFPVRWSRKIESFSGVDSFKEIFFMALSLPVVSISSTGPIVGLVMLFAGRGGFIGPILGMFGFSLGFGLPFLFPQIINIISKSIAWLNQVKVLLGFFSLLFGIKFLSNADIALGWNLIDHDWFIILWMLLSGMMGLYILGIVRLSNDYLHTQNVFGQEYVSISRLLLAIAFFSFVLYLLPGLWGAPLTKINGFLPLPK